MEQLQINCPEGHEIDQDKSDLSKGIVFFKKIKETMCYEDIANKMFSNSHFYINNCYGELEHNNGSCIFAAKIIPLNSITKEQLESILAINKLCNVAKYLNDGWLPKFNSDEKKYNIYFCNEKLVVGCISGKQYYSDVYFKSKKLAQQAIDILGESTIKKTLILNY